MSEFYRALAYIFGFIAFLFAWFMCSVSYGFMGFFLGWIPSLLAGAIVGALWPAIGILAVVYSTQ